MSHLLCLSFAILNSYIFVVSLSDILSYAPFFFVLHVFVFFSLVLSSSGQSSIKRLFVFRIVLGIITKKNILEHLEELKQHTEPLVTSPTPLHMWPPPRHAHTHTLSLALSHLSLKLQLYGRVHEGRCSEALCTRGFVLLLRLSGLVLACQWVWFGFNSGGRQMPSALAFTTGGRLDCSVLSGGLFIFISLVCIFIFISLECIWFCNAGVEYLELPVSLDRCTIRNHPWRDLHFIRMQIPRKEILTMVSMEMLKRAFEGRSTDI